MKKQVPKPIFDTVRARLRIASGRRAAWWRRTGSKARGFVYRTADGARVADEARLAEIAALAVPPAWKFVRVNPSPNGKLQAVGMDGSGRVQYVYHPAFAARRERRKFAKIERFGEFLPKLRRVTDEDLSREGFPREKVLAVMLRLVNSLYIRIGTEQSVRHYKTYGITTLQNRHLEIGRDGALVFSFVGKHHIKHRKVLVDAELAALLAELKALGGARKLFHYLDETGRARAVRPQDVNEYLKAATAPEFSAKDFRTWGGTLLAAIELAEIGAGADERERRRNIVRAVKKVAAQLGNTPAVCRRAYIHPAVIEAYEKGVTLEDFTPRRARRIKRLGGGGEPEERALLKLLREGK